MTEFLPVVIAVPSGWLSARSTTVAAGISRLERGLIAARRWRLRTDGVRASWRGMRKCRLYYRYLVDIEAEAAQGLDYGLAVGGKPSKGFMVFGLQFDRKLLPRKA